MEVARRELEREVNTNLVNANANCLVDLQGPIVQSWVSANSGLKFNPMFQFLHFYISVYFKTLQTKTSIDQDKIT